MQKILDLAAHGVRELVGVAGLGLVAYGAWRIYEPAGFILAGALLIAAAILYPRAEG